MGNKASGIEKAKLSIRNGIKKGNDLSLEYAKHRLLNLASKSELASEIEKNKIKIDSGKLLSKQLFAESLVDFWINEGEFSDLIRYRLTVVRTQLGFNSMNEYIFNSLDMVQKQYDFWSDYGDVSYIFYEKEVLDGNSDKGKDEK